MLGILLCRYEERLEEALKAQNSTKYRGVEKKTTRSRGKESEDEKQAESAVKFFCASWGYAKEYTNVLIGASQKVSFHFFLTLVNYRRIGSYGKQPITKEKNYRRLKGWGWGSEKSALGRTMPVSA